jgi:outer membrane protein OmpA-like peptidoglycan-associated protein
VWSKVRRIRVPARAALLAGLLVELVATAARAQGVNVQFSTRVATGEQPRVTFVASEPLAGLSVELQDDAGRETRARFGATAKGTARTVLLPAEPGRRRYTGRVLVTRGGQTRSRGEPDGSAGREPSRGVRDPPRVLQTTFPLTFEAVVAPRLEIQIDKARVDVAARRLQARFSRPAARAELKVVAATGGEPVAEAQQDLGGRPAGEPLDLTWPAPASGVEVGRIDLRLYDTDGFYAGVSLYPWSVHIPHEEVGFATDSASIDAAEEPKLAASLRKIADALARHRELGPIKLYIAGHTDTVGADAYNLELSNRRARAIATWFRRHGLRLPVLFEGFGEHALLVGTPDQTGEARNRRVDYILAVEDPALKATRFRPRWKALP